MTTAQAIDRADPNKLLDYLRQIGIGSLLQTGLPQFAHGQNLSGAPTNPYVLGTVLGLHTLVPAAFLLRATVKASGVTNGEFTCDAYGTTPLTLHASIAPNGDIVTLGTDAVTDVDLVYTPEIGEEFELTGIPVPSTGIMPIPASAKNKGVVLLREAELLTGAVTGKKIILVPADTNPATGKANLKLAKDTVMFTAADVGAGGGTARCKFWVRPSKSPRQTLAAAESF